MLPKLNIQASDAERLLLKDCFYIEKLKNELLSTPNFK